MTSSGTAPKPGEHLELDFTDLLANGQGVGRADGVVVFCFGPLPGERACVEVTAVKPRYAVARLLELRRTSAERSAPFCPVFGECGGCQLQHVAYAAQLRWKRESVFNALTRLGGLEGVEVRDAIGMREPRAYRNKMSLVVDRRSDPPTLGFYRQRSHDVVPIAGCPIVAPQLDALIGRLTASGAAAVGRVRQHARHLVARAARAADEVALTVTTAQRLDEPQRLGEALRAALPGVAGIENSFDLRGQNAIVGRRHQRMAGCAEVEERVAGLRYRTSPASFFQVNLEVLERIFDYLVPWLQRPGRIVDAYCGAGTFALFFARHGWRVDGIEENPHAVAEAQANARRNDLRERVRFETGRVERVLAAPRGRELLRGARAVFLDPPRKGCEPEVLERLAAAGVRELWYLSCDPATLARDLKSLVAKGYRLGVVQPFDMFPQTGHVETLVRMEYGNT